MPGQNRKISEVVHVAIANILQFEVSDPRLDLVTVTGCRVSADKSYCTVYFSCPSPRQQMVEDAFADASGYIRSCLAHRLTWRRAPELRFCLDKTVDDAQRVESFFS